ncbi:MAG: hypothetical protein CMI18_09300 [Opitutaceae bacterium]|nr:hypothetical protein [Opitutaceae bacterium]
MHSVLVSRTRQVSVVFENVFQPHNIPAALRSCECFGFKDLHVIEESYNHRINPDVTMAVASGSACTITGRKRVEVSLFLST